MSWILEKFVHFKEHEYRYKSRFITMGVPYIYKINEKNYIHKKTIYRIYRCKRCDSKINLTFVHVKDNNEIIKFIYIMQTGYNETVAIMSKYYSMNNCNIKNIISCKREIMKRACL